MLLLRDIWKSYSGLPVLRGISVEIGEGELVSFLGPSGCGKTTLLRIISGLAQPDSGEVVLQGRVLNHVPPHKRGIQMCFQNYALFPHLSVAGNIRYGLEVHKWSKSRIRARVEELLNLVGLEGLEDRRVHELSGGQQQRVALARALALEPKALLLDEPLSNLDANLRIQMRETLRRIQRQVNITTLFVTHDQFEAMTISDRLVVMNKGVVEQLGTPVDIYEKPKSEFVASFVGYVNLLAAVVKQVDSESQRALVGTRLGELEIQTADSFVAAGESIRMVIRPETIRIDDSWKERGVNVRLGNIKDVAYAGSTVKYRVDIDGTDLVVDEYDPSTRGVRRVGEKVAVEVPRNVHILKG